MRLAVIRASLRLSPSVRKFTSMTRIISTPNVHTLRPTPLATSSSAAWFSTGMEHRKEGEKVDGLELWKDGKLVAVADMVVKAKVRTAVGRTNTKGLRVQKVVPGIVEGQTLTPLLIELDEVTLKRQSVKHFFYNSIFKLEIEGHGDEFVIVHNYKYHPVTERPMHVDFLRFPAARPVTVPVHVTTTGAEKCAAIKRGSKLKYWMYIVKCECHGPTLPKYFQIDVSKWPSGRTFYLSDLKLQTPNARVVYHMDSPIIRLEQGRKGDVSVEEEKVASPAAAATPATPAAKPASKSNKESDAEINSKFG